MVLFPFGLLGVPNDCDMSSNQPTHAAQTRLVLESLLPGICSRLCCVQNNERMLTLACTTPGRLATPAAEAMISNNKPVTVQECC